MTAKITYQKNNMNGSTDLKVRSLVKEIIDAQPDAGLFMHLFETRIKEIKSGNHMQPDLVYRVKMEPDYRSLGIWKCNSSHILLLTIRFFSE